MAANSRPIVLDVNGKPAPQYYNPTTDAYEYLQGEAGAARAILWGPDGQALSVVNRKLEVRASEIEDLLAAIRDTDGIRRIAEAVDIADRAARLLGKVSADDGALATLGALADAAKTDPAQAASVIALLKGLLQTLRTDSAKVQLTGSKTTPATTLFDNLSTTGTSTSAWLPCSGYNRAVVLVQTSANFMGYVAIQTRADSDIAVAPMYVLNTAIAMPRSGIPGYYELDVNPMSDLRALAFIEQGSVTVRVWLSATPFVPDLPGAELTMFNALAIRDTAVHRGPIFSGTAFRRARLHVHNTHDSAVTLTAIASDGNWLRKPDGTPHQLQIPANRQRVIYMASDWPVLDGPWPDQVRIDAQCATAPTAGALTVTLIAEAM